MALKRAQLLKIKEALETRKEQENFNKLKLILNQLGF
jgi:uncharacterized protein YpiB (UPF0302 family)